MAPPRVAVCIPTYRRPAKLRALLETLARQEGSEAFFVLVGNNDAATVRPLFPSELGSITRIDEIVVAQRGVVAVRNAMLAHATAQVGSLEWIACLDDDQVPAADWLAQLVSAGRCFEADLVGGPVTQTPEVKTFWARGATATPYLPKEAGRVPTLNEAGNLLISVPFLHRLERPAFASAFGASGGEDYEFFLYARSLGARIFWAPLARVEETIPLERLTFRGLVWRAYSTSVYQMRADLLHRSRASASRALLRNGAALVPAVLRSFVRDRDAAQALTLLARRSAALTGSIVGMTGRTLPRYGESAKLPAHTRVEP